MGAGRGRLGGAGLDALPVNAPAGSAVGAPEIAGQPGEVQLALEVADAEGRIDLALVVTSGTVIIARRQPLRSSAGAGITRGSSASSIRSPAQSFAGIQVRDDTVIGDRKVLDLFTPWPWSDVWGSFSRFLRIALRRDGSPKGDDRPQLVVYSPDAGLLHRSVARKWWARHEPSLHASTLPRPRADRGEDPLTTAAPGADAFVRHMPRRMCWSEPPWC